LPSNPYLDEHFAEVEKIMLLAYEPRYVREAQERSLKIYGAIQALKGVGIDNERIKKEISKEYGITPTYAQNYIDTVEEDERKKSSAKKNRSMRISLQWRCGGISLYKDDSFLTDFD